MSVAQRLQRKFQSSVEIIYAVLLLEHVGELGVAVSGDAGIGEHHVGLLFDLGAELLRGLEVDAVVSPARLRRGAV